MDPKQGGFPVGIVWLARLAEPRHGVFAGIMRACLSRRFGPLRFLFVSGRMRGIGRRRGDGV